VENKPNFVDMMEYGVTNFGNIWVLVKLFQIEQTTTTLLMVVTLVLHQNLTGLVPFINCFLFVFVFFFRIAHFYVWHATMHIPGIISWAILHAIKVGSYLKPGTCESRLL
jgi:ABC-type proline/glycine betaine transport system permease subunit